MGNKAYACFAHILDISEYKEKVLDKQKPWIEYSQFEHEILAYPVSNSCQESLTKKINFINDAEFTYRFIHPAIAQTYKYSLKGPMCISYIGKENSLLTKLLSNNSILSPIKKQIILIGVASAMKYLESKGVSHYCLDIKFIILDHNQFPKLACCGLPSVFKPESWDDKISPIKSFGLFAKTILNNNESGDIPDSIPEQIKHLIDKCINFQSNSNDSLTFDEIFNFFSDEENYIPGVDSEILSDYLKWLEFQDKFPCNYFFDLNPEQKRTILKYLSMDNIDDTKAFNNFFKGISKGKNNYPRDLFSAFYFSLCAQNYFDADRFFSLFQVQFGIPDWLKEINEKVKNAVYENDKDKHSIFFNGNNPLLIKDKENRNKLNSNEKEDIEFVVNSYINGFKTEKRIKKSESAAFYHLKTVLNRKEIINNKDIQSFLLTEIGKMYLNGIGIPQNLHKSLIYFKNALINDPNNLDAQKHMGIAINMKDELDRSITKLNLKSLNEIDFKEALHYGFSFLHGINGFPKSINHAIKYYLKAATIDPYAYCILGNIFRFGIECSQNLKKASK